MENEWHEQLRTPPPQSLTTLPVFFFFFYATSSEQNLLAGYLKPEPCTRVRCWLGPFRDWQLLQGVGWSCRSPPPPRRSLVSRELLLKGPWGLPPSVLHNLSLENCKFISQKGLRAEMTSKRANHFLQSLTELRLGGGGCDHRRGAPFTLVQPSCLPTDHCWHGPKGDGAKSGP